MSIETLATAQLVAVVNQAISDYSLPVKEIGTKTFKSKELAVKRIQLLMDTHRLTLQDGKLVQRAAEAFTEEDIAEIMGETKADPIEAARTVDPDFQEDPVPPYAAPAPAAADEPAADLDAGEVPEPAVTQPRSSTGTKRRGRLPRVNHAPKDRILACRDRTSQSVLRDQFLTGRTIATATVAVNNERQTWGKDALSTDLVYSTLMWDLRSCKGYGVRAEVLNGEQLHAIGDLRSAHDLGFVAPLNATSAELAAAAQAEGYDPDVTMTTYFLVLPEGVEAPAHTPRKGK